jgi:hypothetical protein
MIVFHIRGHIPGMKKEFTDFADLSGGECLILTEKLHTSYSRSATHVAQQHSSYPNWWVAKIRALSLPKERKQTFHFDQ